MQGAKVTAIISGAVLCLLFKQYFKLRQLKQFTYDWCMRFDLRIVCNDCKFEDQAAYM